VHIHIYNVYTVMQFRITFLNRTDEEGSGGGSGSDGADTDGARALAAPEVVAGLLAPDEVGVEPAADVAEPPMAFALKASKVLSADGLTAKTIPLWQWVPVLQ
jgi:hypothetical protein